MLILPPHNAHNFSVLPKLNSTPIFIHHPPGFLGTPKNESKASSLAELHHDASLLRPVHILPMKAHPTPLPSPDLPSFSLSRSCLYEYVWHHPIKELHERDAPGRLPCVPYNRKEQGEHGGTSCGRKYQKISRGELSQLLLSD